MAHICFEVDLISYFAANHLIYSRATVWCGLQGATSGDTACPESTINSMCGDAVEMNSP
jgi:hypothetical protein